MTDKKREILKPLSQYAEFIGPVGNFAILVEADARDRMGRGWIYGNCTSR